MTQGHVFAVYIIVPVSIVRVTIKPVTLIHLVVPVLPRLYLSPRL